MILPHKQQCEQADADMGLERYWYMITDYTVCEISDLIQINLLLIWHDFVFFRYKSIEYFTYIFRQLYCILHADSTSDTTTLFSHLSGRGKYFVNFLPSLTVFIFYFSFTDHRRNILNTVYMRNLWFLICVMTIHILKKQFLAFNFIYEKWDNLPKWDKILTFFWLL